MGVRTYFEWSPAAPPFGSISLPQSYQLSSDSKQAEINYTILITSIEHTASTLSTLRVNFTFPTRLDCRIFSNTNSRVSNLTSRDADGYFATRLPTTSANSIALNFVKARSGVDGSKGSGSHLEGVEGCCCKRRAPVCGMGPTLSFAHFSPPLQATRSSCSLTTHPRNPTSPNLVSSTHLSKSCSTGYTPPTSVCLTPLPQNFTSPTPVSLTLVFPRPISAVHTLLSFLRVHHSRRHPHHRNPRAVSLLPSNLPSHLPEPAGRPILQPTRAPKVLPPYRSVREVGRIFFLSLSGHYLSKYHAIF